jgi:hypothetical protein
LLFKRLAKVSPDIPEPIIAIFFFINTNVKHA